MKTRDQLLLEDIYVQISSAKYTNLIETELFITDQIIEEAFGDFIKKVAGGIKGGAQKITSKIKETLTTGIATKLVNAIVSAIPKNELENFVNIIAAGKVPKDKVTQVQQMVAQVPENTVSECISDIFTEELILEALTAGNLLILEQEAKTPPPTPYQKSSGISNELQRYAKEVARTIQTTYKDKGSMAAVIPKFVNSVYSRAGINPPRTAAAGASPSTTSSTPGTSPSSENTKSATSGESKGIMSTIGATSGTGVVGKLMGFVKKNPKISAAAGAALLGIVVAAFAGAAPVMVPVLLTSLKGAGGAAALSAIAQKTKGVGGALMDRGIEGAKQQFKDNKIDAGTTAKHAAIGAATAGIGKLLSIGLGNIAKEVLPQDFAYRDKQIVAQNGTIVKNTDDIVAGKRVNLWGHGTNYDVTRTPNK